MKSKKGNMTTKEIIELILATAGVFVVVLLLYTLLSPDFNKNEETAKSYFNSLGKEFDIADTEGTGTFSPLILTEGEDHEGIRFYIAYFGEKITFRDDGPQFSSIGSNINHICVCYSEGTETKCGSCKNLDRPAKHSSEADTWSIEIKGSVEIAKIITEEGASFYNVA